MNVVTGRVPDAGEWDWDEGRGVLGGDNRKAKGGAVALAGVDRGAAN